MGVAEIINIVLAIVAVAVSLVSYYLYIKSVVTKAATHAINNAEEEGKTGEEKLNAAVEQIYALVPAFLKAILNKNFIRQLTQEAFDKIEAYAEKQVQKKALKSAAEKDAAPPKKDKKNKEKESQKPIEP